MVSLATVGRDHHVVEAGRGVLGARRVRADRRRIERGFVSDDVLWCVAGRDDRASEERFGCDQAAGPRQPSIEHLAELVDAAVQVAPLAQDLHIRLIDEPGRAEWIPVAANLPRKCRPELLYPAQDRPPTDVDTAVGQEAGDPFSRRTQLQVVAANKMMSRGKRWPATRLIDSLVACRPQARQARITRPRRS
jgi:hypothetical protein